MECLLDAIIEEMNVSLFCLREALSVYSHNHLDLPEISVEIAVNFLHS